MTTRGLTRTWLEARDSVATLETQLAAARAAVVTAEAAMVASLGENANAQNAVVVTDEGRVAVLRGGAATEGLLIEADDEPEPEP